MTCHPDVHRALHCVSMLCTTALCAETFHLDWRIVRCPWIPGEKGQMRWARGYQVLIHLIILISFTDRSLKPQNTSLFDKWIDFPIANGFLNAMLCSHLLERYVWEVLRGQSLKVSDWRPKFEKPAQVLCGLSSSGICRPKQNRVAQKQKE